MSKILVVEDEESFRDALAFVLSKEGFEVKLVKDGQAAVDTFQKEGADLILLDLMLPGMSGLEVCKNIRAKS
ncbi:MAG: response regulator, partial [Candidatus Nanopelagicales bacterium]